MKVEYEISKEEFTDFVDALNNGFCALKSIYNALELGCQVPLAFNKFYEMYDIEELTLIINKRMYQYSKFYEYLERLEKNNMQD